MLSVKGQDRKNAAAIAAASLKLSLAEGLAVGALVLSGVCFVSTHQNTVQRAVVLGIAMVCAGLNGAFDALIGIVVHVFFLLFVGFVASMTRAEKNESWKSFPFRCIFSAPMV